jgi:hypothetical protein
MQVLQAMEELRALLQLKASMGAPATAGSRPSSIPPPTPATTRKKLHVQQSSGTTVPSGPGVTGQAAAGVSLGDSLAAAQQQQQQQQHRASSSRGSLALGTRAPAAGHTVPGLISSTEAAAVQHGSRRHSSGAIESAIEAAAAGKGLPCKQPPSLVKGALKLLGALAGRSSRQG